MMVKKETGEIEKKLDDSRMYTNWVNDVTTTMRLSMGMWMSQLERNEKRSMGGLTWIKKHEKREEKL